MKKLLLLAAMAASMSVANAEDFGTYFALSLDGEAISNGQTVTVAGYYDPILKGNPEIKDIMPDYQSSSFDAQAKITATNVYDEAMDIAFTLKRTEPGLDVYPTQGSVIGSFQLCFEYDNAPGNCLGPQNDIVTSPSSLEPINPEGGYLVMDVDQVGFTDMTPVTLQLDLCVMEGGEKIEGTDCTVYVKFTHEADITLGVNGVEMESAIETYYNLQGMPVAQPQKGGIYVVRKGNKVSKRVF